MSAYDNLLALDQMKTAYASLLARPVVNETLDIKSADTSRFSKDGLKHPRILTLGGDHTIVRYLFLSLQKSSQDIL